MTLREREDPQYYEERRLRLPLDMEPISAR